MILQRLFSKTWENLKDPAERHKKAVELNEARNKIGKRRTALKENYMADMEKAGLGELKNKDGKRINTKAVEERYKADVADLNKYHESITDRTNRRPKPKPKPQPPGMIERIRTAGKKIATNPKVKMGAKITAGVGIAAGVGYGAKKAYDHKQNKKKEEEVRGRFNPKK